MDRNIPSSLVDSDPTSRTVMERIRDSKRSIFLAFGLGAGALVLTGCQSGDPEGPEPTASHSVEESIEPTVAGAYETAEPTPTDISTEVPTPAEAVDTSNLPANWVKMGIYEFLDTETKATVDSLASMDVSTFREQPDEARIGFADYVVYNASPYADKWLKEKGVNVSYTRNPQTAQEVTDNQFYTFLVASHLVTILETGDGAVSSGFDHVTARKLASANVISPEDYVEWDAEMDTIDQSTMPSIKNSYEALRSIVTTETLSDDGVLTYEYHRANDPTLRQNTVKRFEYPTLTSDGTVQTTFIGY